MFYVNFRSKYIQDRCRCTHSYNALELYILALAYRTNVGQPIMAANNHTFFLRIIIM